MDPTIIYYNNVCLDPLWNSSFTLTSDRPQFTKCFQQTVLAWPAHILFLVLSAAKVIHLWCASRKTRQPVCGASLLFILRAVCITCLFGLSVMLLAKDAYDKSHKKMAPAVLIGNTLRSTSFLCALLLLVYERYCRVASSGPQFVFFGVLTLTETMLLYLRSVEKTGDVDATDFDLTVAMYILTVIAFLLCFFSDSMRRKGRRNNFMKQWPELRSSYPSFLGFLWISRIVWNARRRLLTNDDIFELPDTAKGNYLIPEFDKAWSKVVAPGDRLKQKNISQLPNNNGRLSSNSDLTETPATNKRIFSWFTRDSTKLNTKPPFSLLKVLVRLYGLRYIFGFFIKIIGDTLVVIQPIIMRELIKTAENKENLWIGVFLTILFFLTNLVKNFTHHHSSFISTRIGLEIKSSLMASIFQKSMRMSSESRKQYTSGEIVTMMSVDVQKIQEMCRILVRLAGAPIQVVASAVLLYYTIGISVLAGLATLFLLLPINSVLASKMRKTQAINMTLKDERVKLTTDVLIGVKVLKFYAWDKAFEEKLHKIRNEELKNLRTLAYYRSGMAVNNWTTPYLVTLATFSTYELISEHGHLDPATAFVSLAYFSILRSPLVVITHVVTSVVMSAVSLRRINDFLFSDDIIEYVGKTPKTGCAVSAVKSSFAWDSFGEPVVRNVTMHIPDKCLTMIVGKVGCGKSSLLSGLLGEMKLVNGSLDIKGSVAYVAQQAWIQNCSLKENILFGSPFDPDRYNDVLKACALERDLSLLPQGDETEIGEKGINLSGGQKQRVALARAVYSDKDVYLLDDPLSAMDVHVGKHIFDQVLGVEGILKNKTRILVTHGVHWLPFADTVVMLANGVVSHIGSFEDLISKESYYDELLKLPDKPEETESLLSSSFSERDRHVDVDYFERSLSIIHFTSEESIFFGMEKYKPDISLDRYSLVSKNILERRHISSNTDKSQLLEANDDLGKIIHSERITEGTVKLKVIFAWISAASRLGILLAYIILAFFQIANIESNFWIQFWATDPMLTNLSLSFTTEYSKRNQLYIGVYGAFGAIQFVLFVIGYTAFWDCAIRASNNLHNGMLRAVMRSPMEFFDSTPVGRILNRFSVDTDIMDYGLPMVFVDLLNFMNQVIGTVLVVCLNVPLFVTVIIPIFLLFYLVMKFYLPTACQLQRIDTVAKSPIYSHFSEAIGGATTIRAFSHHQRFLQESRLKVDESVVKSLILYACSSWLNIMIGNVGMIFVLAAMMFAVTTVDLVGGHIGLAISYCVEFSVFLTTVVQQMTELIQHSVAIERIQEFGSLKSEGIAGTEVVPDIWPSKGQIEFKNFELRYREGFGLALKGITAVIWPGEKVGIVGRTGAGKSTITLALFRIIEAAGGSICIDGINIADVDLHRLRSSISILPQDPVLFSGSLRMNIDPLDDYSDQEVMRALERAHLKDFVTGVTCGLKFDVGEEGKNMSVGQRQLVCLARSLLKQNKILVLDEATAAVDIHTDSLIQETIRSEFKECTVITIAHRINTIMDYDRVIVMDGGEIKEIGLLKDLLKNSCSLFFGLAKEAKLV